MTGLGFGGNIESFVLSISSAVASPGAAGLAAGLIFCALVISIISFQLGSAKRHKAVKSALKVIQLSSSRSDFTSEFQSINESLTGSVPYEKRKSRPFDWAIKRAWDEYAETLVLPEVHTSGQVIRNTVRPSYFFNSVDLGFDHGFWRHLPGIFVSVGLFLTFLGIIAAFGVLVGKEGGFAFDNQGMGLFLNTAKSKFIMSLSGLFASIIFGIYYRYRTYRLDHVIASLADEIEYRVLFQAPEQIAAEQLKAVQEQSEQLKVLGNDLGAQVGAHVGQVISENFGEVFETMGNTSQNEVRGMVSNLGEALHAKLNESLNEMSNTLGTINKTLVDVADVLVSSGDSIGSEMANGVANLNGVAEALRLQMEQQSQATQEQLQVERAQGQRAMADLLAAIENNTRESSSKLESAAADLSEAAQNLAGSIAEAGDAASAKATATVAAIGDHATDSLSKASLDLNSRLSDVTGAILENLANFQEGIEDKLASPIREMSQNLAASNRELGRHAQAIETATDSQTDAANQLSQATNSLVQAGKPIASSVERIVAINETIRRALESNVALMETTKTSVDGSMKALDLTMQQLKTVVSDVEDIDAGLGKAFEKISQGLVASQEQVKAFADDINGQFTQGIQSIQSVMDGLSEFEPVRMSA